MSTEETMDEMKIEWVDKRRLSEIEQGVTWHDMYEVGCTPVVRLADVDTLIQEAVWAMEHIYGMRGYVHSTAVDRAQAFLARTDVQAWRGRQKAKHE